MINRRCLQFCCFSLLLTTPWKWSYAGGDVIQEMSDLVHESWQAHSPAPRLSSMGYVLTPDIAYQIQALAVSQRSPGRQFDGYKAGLTAPGSAASFGLTAPVAGVLLKGTELAPARDGIARVDLSTYNRAMIEVELGFVLSDDIKDASLSLEDLKQRVARVIPVVELPDLGFQGGKPDGVDVIAANVAARYYVAGAGDLSAGNALNQLSVALYHDDVLILNGQAKDAMGDQWRALHWLVNQTLETGWPLRAGHILITGALGKMLPLEAGDYRAELRRHSIDSVAGEMKL